MALKELKIRVKGVAPLIMHNSQLADPMNKWTRQMKEVSGKRKKTDADFVEMAMIEFKGGLHFDEAKGIPFIPSTMIEAALINGAKAAKQGKQFKSAVFCNDDAPLDGFKKTTREELWEDERYRHTASVRVGQARVMRTRPIFHEWSTNIVLYFDDEQVNAKDVMRAMTVAGAQSGFGDFRPRFGRFEVSQAS